MRFFLLLFAVITSQLTVICFQNNVHLTKQHKYSPQKIKLSMSNKNKKKPASTSSSKSNSIDIKTTRSVAVDEKLIEVKTDEELLYDELKLLCETKKYPDDLELKSMIALGEYLFSIHLSK